MYNEFAPKHYKGKCPCTTKTLYNEKTLTGKLHKYFLIYFETFCYCSHTTIPKHTSQNSIAADNLE